MWGFLAARLWAQRFALLFAVIGLALAIGAFSASWQIFKSVRAGHPIGSNFEGEVFSVLPYISSMQMNFFVDPAQVAALQETAGASLQLLASSGTRAGSVTLDSGEVEVGYEAVSENYFAGLGLRTTPKSWQPTPEPERRF